MKRKEYLKKIRKNFLVALGTVSTLVLTSTPVSANAVADSAIVKGTEKLIEDLTTWLMILAPVVGGLVIIYFFIRRSAADEMEQKKWNNRITTAIVSVIGAVLASATLKLIISYYVY